MTLLIFAAGLTARFRFVSTVTILQQTDRCRRRSSSAAEVTARKAKGNRGLPSAKELGKRWRFFPTYAEL